ncbi:MAG: hypothetical protein ABFD13_03090 [Candidatus Cryosericum sp.]
MDAKKISDNPRSGSMTGRRKKAIKWFWLWPILATVLGYISAVFGIDGPDVIFFIAPYAAPFVGFGFLLMAVEKRAQMRPFLCMFLVVGLVLNARGFYELARWVAQGLMTTKIQTEGIPGILLGLPAFVPVFRWTIFTPYAFMTSVPILLLLLIIPHFLALPVFWLWTVLSVLYVVLTSRAWKRMGASVHEWWKKLRRSEPQHPGDS